MIRVTSGLMILAKSKEFASKISIEIRNKNTKKVSIAEVLVLA
jgi:23S rRNA-/tRNA-specific pseudouridylate synthase